VSESRYEIELLVRMTVTKQSDDIRQIIRRKRLDFKLDGLPDILQVLFFPSVLQQVTLLLNLAGVAHVVDAASAAILNLGRGNFGN